MGKQWKLWETIFLDSKITADGDCSHEIKRHLLLGRKAMTNLDSISKCRNITLTTKVCVVKAVVFPVAMCGCESWTKEKAEHQRTDAFELWFGEGSWRVPWRLSARRSNQSILKEISPECSLEGCAEAEALILWPLDAKNWLIGKDLDARKDWRQEQKGTTEDEIVGWYHRLDGNEFVKALGVADGQGIQMFCSLWGCKELDMIELLHWTELMWLYT